MSKKSKIFSATVLATTLLVPSVVHSPTVSAETKEVKATEVPTNKTGRVLDTNKPYYYYNGYFAYSGKTVLNYDFKRAIDYDNVMIDGYMVNKKRTKQPTAAGFYSHDTIINKADKNTIKSIVLKAPNNSITKSEFEKSYKSFKLVSQTMSNDKTSVTNLYKTRANTYFSAYFEKGKLSQFIIQ